MTIVMLQGQPKQGRVRVLLPTIATNSVQGLAVGEGSMGANHWWWEYTYQGPASGPLCGKK